MSKLDSLRIHAHIKEISAPFSNGEWVEIKFKLDHREDIGGEFQLRVWAKDAAAYHVGQELCGVFSPIGK